MINLPSGPRDQTLLISDLCGIPYTIIVTKTSRSSKQVQSSEFMRRNNTLSFWASSTMSVNLSTRSGTRHRSKVVSHSKRLSPTSINRWKTCSGCVKTMPTPWKTGTLRVLCPADVLQRQFKNIPLRLAFGMRCAGECYQHLGIASAFEISSSQLPDWSVPISFHRTTPRNVWTPLRPKVSRKEKGNMPVKRTWISCPEPMSWIIYRNADLFSK